MDRFPLRAGLLAGLLLTTLGAHAASARPSLPGTLDVSGTTAGAPTAALPLFGSTPGACTLAATPEPYVPSAFTVTPDGSYAVGVVEPVATIPDTDDTVLLVYEGTFDPADACAHFVGIGNATPGSGLTASLAAASDYVLVVAGFLGTEDAFTVRITGPEGSTITPAGPNGPPVADAGPDQTVSAGGDGTASVTLDGSGSTDPDGDVLTYAWSEGSTEIASGLAPTVALPVGPHTLTLTVTDPSGSTATDEVDIAVQPATGPPVAHAGPDQTVVAGQTVTLDGAGSTGALTYAWTLAPTGTLSDATAAGPTFCAAAAAVYTATLVVSDGTSNSAPDAAVVTAVSQTAALDALASAVAALRAAGVLTKGQANSLAAKLNSARREMVRGRPAQAAVHLGDFATQVASLQASGVLTADQAAALTASATALRTALTAPCTAAPALAAVKADAPAFVGLGAAYPNPSAAGVTVPYGLAGAAHVRLAVYDALGREVAVLVDGLVEAGSHTASFGGVDLPAAVYLVRLTTDGGLAQTERLTLLR